MKYILTIILAFSLLLHSIGVYIFFGIRMCYTKFEAWEQVCQNLPNEKLAKIVDVAGERNKIEWEKTGKEFRYNGDMYDVVRKQHSGDSTIYFCYADIRESKLISEINKQVEDYLKDHPAESRKGNNLLKNFMNSFYMITPIRKYSNLLSIESFHLFTFLFIPEVYTGIMPPPPKDSFLV